MVQMVLQIRQPSRRVEEDIEEIVLFSSFDFLGDSRLGALGAAWFILTILTLLRSIFKG
jgi:hypothetical protein